MKQRIAVRAIIRKEDKTLLLRRSSGRDSILKHYELPGGRIEYGEQPEPAVRRYIRDDTGLEPQTIQLSDVITYIDQDDRDIQYALIVFLVSVANGHDKIRLGEGHDHYLWKKKADLPVAELTASTRDVLLLPTRYDEPAPDAPAEKRLVTAAMETRPSRHAIIYSDGGSRGNPGPSAAGFVIMDDREQVQYEGGEYLGITTNNQAEYHGVRLGLERAIAVGMTTVDFRIDSMLVVNQMNGIYKIKNRELWPIHERIKELVKQFDHVTFTHVRREFNQLADGMVNKILNQHADEGAKLV